MGDEPVGEMENIVGIIAGDEIGFANWIDMDYKGKDDQVSVPFYLYQGEAEDFRKLCGKLGIDLVEYPVCTRCYKPIFGSFMYDQGGEVCYSCETNARKPA